MSNEIRAKLMDYKLKNYCCSQIIMEMGLELLGKENPDMIAAMAGLCEAPYEEHVCGVVSAARCLLYLADPQAAVDSTVAEYMDWFEDAFGSVVCSELLQPNPLEARVEKCPMMIESSYEMLCELMELD